VTSIKLEKNCPGSRIGVRPTACPQALASGSKLFLAIGPEKEYPKLVLKFVGVKVRNSNIQTGLLWGRCWPWPHHATSLATLVHN